MSKPHRLSQAEMIEVQKQIEDLLQQGLIETSSSPWPVPIVCTRTKDGQWWLEIDYRALNAQAISNAAHPIPLIEDLLDRLGNGSFFSTLDFEIGILSDAY